MIPHATRIKQVAAIHDQRLLQCLLDGGKIVLKKLLDGLTTKPAELTGRINSDTIVVRVITG